MYKCQKVIQQKFNFLRSNLVVFDISITTFSTEKRVRNYSEFTRKRVGKKTGP